MFECCCIRGAYFHSKTVCVDSAVCSIGSANIDIRSFSINYETNLVIDDAAVTRELEADFHTDPSTASSLRTPSTKHVGRRVASSIRPFGCFSPFSDRMTRILGRCQGRQSASSTSTKNRHIVEA